MKIAIMGSRSINDKDLVYGVLDDNIKEGNGIPNITVLGGGADGCDHLIKDWALDNMLDFVLFEPYHRLDPKAKFDPRFFFIRNKAVVRNADTVVVLWDGVSTDIKHVIDYAEKLNKETTIITVSEE